MATVYNCLDALVKCGMVRQVTLDRGATRFCPNMREHGHFYCDTCEQVTDLELAELPTIRLPAGFTAARYDLAIHGQCRACATTGGGRVKR
jgi:Fur family peroxide stress response transcriptional regulator